MSAADRSFALRCLLEEVSVGGGAVLALCSLPTGTQVGEGSYLFGIHSPPVASVWQPRCRLPCPPPPKPHSLPEGKHMKRSGAEGEGRGRQACGERRIFKARLILADDWCRLVAHEVALVGGASVVFFRHASDGLHTPAASCEEATFLGSPWQQLHARGATCGLVWDESHVGGAHTACLWTARLFPLLTAEQKANRYAVASWWRAARWLLRCAATSVEGLLISLYG